MHQRNEFDKAAAPIMLLNMTGELLKEISPLLLPPKDKIHRPQKIIETVSANMNNAAPGFRKLIRPKAVFRNRDELPFEEVVGL